VNRVCTSNLCNVRIDGEIIGRIFAEITAHVLVAVDLPVSEIYRLRQLGNLRLRKPELREVKVFVRCSETFLDEAVVGQAEVKHKLGLIVRSQSMT
jgi:hypothetical protein